MYLLIMQDTAYSNYPFQHFSISSLYEEKIDIMNLRDSLLSTWMRKLPKELFYHNLIPMLEIDLSSIRPHFEIKNETSLIEGILEMAVPEDMLEFDIIIRMPPKKEWSARLRVKSVEKATPRIVEPEGF